MLNDLSAAVRTLTKRPGYAVPVVLTLALGLGATTVIFTLADAALFRPLPFAEPDRLVLLTGVAGPERSPRGGSMPEIADWRRMNVTLEDVSLYDETSFNMRIGGDVVRVEAEMVNAGFFRILGVAAARGRTFLPEEDAVPDRDAVAVISHGLWRDRFGGDPAVLQRTVHLNDRAFTIVGVMPERFAGVSFDTDVWVPSMMVTLTSGRAIVANRGTRWLGAIGRLRRAVTIERAQDDLHRVAAILEQRHPDFNRQRSVQVADMRDALLGDTRQMMVALLAAVLLFLTVACANAAGLQLARAASRRRELAVRLALGASRWHVLRQLLTESVVLSLAAGAAGTLLAAWALGAVVSFMPPGALPRHVAPSLDPRALAFALAVSLLAGALVAILPAIAATRGSSSDALKDGQRAAGPGLGSIRRLSFQQALVVGEIAVAMALLAATGLMVRSLERQMKVPVGFEPEGVTVARLTLPASRYAPPDRVAFVERLVQRLHETPGVTAAAVATSLPFTGSSNASIMTPEGAHDPDRRERYYRNAVTPDFFAALGIPVTRGRIFTDDDRDGAPLVAVINESAAMRLWGTHDAVGRRFRLGNAAAPSVEIVGVVGDARFRDLRTDFAAPRLEPDLYFPFAQRPDDAIEVAVRTGDGAPLPLALFQQAVAAVDTGLPLYAVQPLGDAVRQQTATSRFGSALLSVFSAGALLLAAVGLYGLIAYVVGRCRREIGLRLALGADARRVVALIVGNGMALVGVGLLVGTAGAIAAGRALEHQLFETARVDAATFVTVAVLLVAVSAAASLLATWRAVQVEPHASLRAE